MSCFRYDWVHVANLIPNDSEVIDLNADKLYVGLAVLYFFLTSVLEHHIKKKKPVHALGHP